MPFKETKEGQTHYYGDNCGEPAHNQPMNNLQKELEAFDNLIAPPEMKRIECKGVGDNNGFYEFTPKTISTDDIKSFLC